ncbi:NAD(P)/FAD-dependent oxidoreductase [bacterium]|nr:NAD(P)/FAD-dependent oxidoreductase [bacterium]
MRSPENSRVAIIGAGAAGIACAVQLHRSGITPLWFEAAHPGGLLFNANLMENYPGFPGGITGAELARLFVIQAEAEGIHPQRLRIERLEYTDGQFRLTAGKQLFTAEIVVLATGTVPRPFLDFPVSPEVMPLVYREIAPLNGVSGKRVAIVGAGDAAFDHALYLALANEVFILNRGIERRCLPLLCERAMTESRIHYRENHHLLRLERSGTGLVLSGKTSNSEWELEVDYLIAAVGREPADSLLTGLAEKREELVQSRALHLIGDLANGRYRQVALAVGDGVRAAMEISAWLT